MKTHLDPLLRQRTPVHDPAQHAPRERPGAARGTDTPRSPATPSNGLVAIPASPPVDERTALPVAAGVAQLEPKTIDAPTPEELELLTIWNQASHKLIELLGYEKKGTHGTNFKHAMSMMRSGIKVEIPPEKRTSAVTAEDHRGFYVDTSESGDTHAPEFAEMAAYGTPDTPGDEAYEADAAKAMRDYDAAVATFEKHKKQLEGKQRGVVLEVWGPPELKPETDDPEREEAIYLKGAEDMLVTIREYV